MIRCRSDKGLEDRDAELCLKVYRQYTEQSQSAKGGQRVNALVRRYRRDTSAEVVARSIRQPQPP